MEVFDEEDGPHVNARVTHTLSHSLLHHAVKRKCDSLLQYLLSLPLSLPKSTHNGDALCLIAGSQYPAESRVHSCLITAALLSGSQACLRVALTHFYSAGNLLGPEMDASAKLDLVRTAVYHGGSDDVCSLILYHAFIAQNSCFHTRGPKLIAKSTSREDWDSVEQLLQHSMRYKYLYHSEWSDRISNISIDLSPIVLMESSCRELLELLKVCTRRGLRRAACLLLQLHGSWIHADNNGDFDSPWYAVYCEVFADAAANGHSLIAMSVIKVMRECLAAPVPPPALNTTDMPPETFFLLLQYVARVNTLVRSYGAAHMLSSSSESEDDDRTKIELCIGDSSNYINYDELKLLIFSDMSDATLVDSVEDLAQNPSRFILSTSHANIPNQRMLYTRIAAADGDQNVPPSPPESMKSEAELATTGQSAGGSAVAKNKRIVVITSKGKSRSFTVNAK
jgi:hypothetical protein